MVLPKFELKIPTVRKPSAFLPVDILLTFVLPQVGQVGILDYAVPFGFIVILAISLADSTRQS